METTLIILKPDAVQRGLMGRIISRFEDKGLQVVGCKLMQISQQLASGMLAGCYPARAVWPRPLSPAGALSADCRRSAR